MGRSFTQRIQYSRRNILSTSEDLVEPDKQLVMMITCFIMMNMRIKKKEREDICVRGWFIGCCSLLTGKNNRITNQFRYTFLEDQENH